MAVVGVAVVSPARPPAFLKWSTEDRPRNEHDLIATNLIEHGSYSLDFEGGRVPTVARGPLYPLYLVVIYKTFGLENHRAERITDQLVHALSAALLVSALLTFVAPWPAVAGGLLYAFWPTTFYFVAKGGAETLQILTFAASLYCLVLLRARPGMARAVGLGILLGAACLSRANAVAMLAVVGAWAAAAVVRRSLPLRYAVAIALSWTLTMSPWWIRNYRVTGEFVPFHTLGWLVSYADDVFDGAKQSLAARGDVNLDVRSEYPRFRESVVDSSFWVWANPRDDAARERRYRQIMLRKFREPGYLAGKMARNAVQFWSASGTVANDRKLLATSLAWLSLFIAGLVLALREPALRWCAGICSAVVILMWLMYLPVFALFRYSITVAPFVAATIALGLGAVWRTRPREAASPADDLGRA